ncbi:tetratricopeptide repeat protein [Oxalobacteraceae bacterium OTU3CINTB1]|nr:tetratricopeptide repeat protein [Oxalobacteraceae bacterium OTU3CINTB1]
MKTKSLASIALLAGAMALAAPVFAAAPTVHDVYVAAEAGKFTEAQALMDQVLKEHPNSAKAHFVEAELLAKQGKFAAAQKSLETAERLSPGLPKVDATAVSKLRAVIATGEAKPKENYTQHKPAAEKTGYNSGGYANGASAGSGSSGGGIPWGTVLLMGGLLVGFIFIASRFMSRRAQQGGAGGMGGGGFNQGGQGFNPGGTPPGYPPGGGYPQQGYGPGYGQQPQGNGMGSRIMGGLATGAALGAGLVAGEAIARQFTGGHENGGNAANDQGRSDIVYDDPAQSNIVQNDDMGGNDFGVSGGWDDSGGADAGGGSDEWN